MRRFGKILLIVLAVLLVLGGCAAAIVYRGVQNAQREHLSVYRAYQALRRNALDSTLTVMENGQTAAQVSFADLGLLEDLNRQIDGQFSPADRMDEATFAALPLEVQLAYSGHSDEAVHLHGAVASPACLSIDILYDQLSTGRLPGQEGSLSYADGQFSYTPPTAGNALDKDALYQALYAQAGGYAIDDTSPGAYTFDLSAANCYAPAPAPLANVEAEFSRMLEEQVAGMEISVTMKKGVNCALTTGTLQSLLSVGDDGSVVLDEARLRQIIDQWAETYNQHDITFTLDTYAGGEVTVPFLKNCDRVLDTEALYQALAPAILSLESVTADATFRILDETGKDLGLTDTYIEVDMTNQLMTFFKDGQVVVSTPIVSGNNMYTATKRGLYYTSKMERNTTLYGPTWADFVEYWVAITDDNILGIHDASWRDEFGGTIFLQNGSHGCINTPTEAMKTLYENVEPGIAVLIYHRVEPDTLTP